MIDTYSIVRHFHRGVREVLKEGQTLEEAQKHCVDPETSSRTCSQETLDRVGACGAWFDSYTKEV
jgi:hypothetical protein